MIGLSKEVLPLLVEELQSSSMSNELPSLLNLIILKVVGNYKRNCNVVCEGKETQAHWGTTKWNTSSRSGDKMKHRGVKLWQPPIDTKWKGGEKILKFVTNKLCGWPHCGFWARSPVFFHANKWHPFRPKQFTLGCFLETFNDSPPFSL